MPKKNIYLSFFDNYLLFIKFIVLHLQREINTISIFMKLSLSKNSLAILSILAGVVYLLILVSDISKEFDYVGQSFKSGLNSNKGKEGDVSETEFNTETFFAKLKVKDKQNFYPDSILNNKSNRYLPARIEKMDIFYQHHTSLPLWSIFSMLLLVLLGFPFLALLILIPIEFYKLIFSLYKNNVFTRNNVTRIKKIGIFYIIIYAYLLAFEFYQYFLAKSVVDLEKYEIASPTLVNELLLTGLVALIFATMLNRAIVLKEEQELTI